MFKYILFIILFAFIKLFADNNFYTISICSDEKYESSLYCKDNIIKETELDIIITKSKDTLYRTNYGKFGTKKEAYLQMKKLSRSTKQFGVFVVNIDKNNTEFELFEVHKKSNNLNKISSYNDNSIIDLNLIKKNMENSEKSDKSEFYKEKVIKKLEKEDITENDKVDFETEFKKIVEFENVVKKVLLEHPAKDVKSENSESKRDLGVETKKIAYLTFDDGPIGATKNILNVFEEENIPATLFFIGYQIKNNPIIYEDALNSKNITVANHTYSHASDGYQRFYSNSDGVLADIDKNQRLLDKYIDNSLKPLRFAGRNVFRLKDIKTNDVALSKEHTQNELLSYDKVHNSGYSIYGWDVEWEFDENGKPVQSPEQVLQYMETSYKNSKTKKMNKVILLTHDIMFSNHYNGKANLKKLIKLLKENNWSFESINHY